MKSYAVLLSVGLASAQVLRAGGLNGLNLGGGAVLNNFNVNGNAFDFDPASLGINLADLGFSNLDFSNQNAMVDAIQSLLSQLCLSNQLNFNNINGLGLNNQVDLFLQLAQLQQLQNLGFVGVGGAANIFNSNQIFGSPFNVGVFKRELEKAKKTMKRVKLRRGTGVAKRQCQGVNAAQPSVVANNAVTIATANPSAAFTIATAAPPVAAAATPVAAVATPVAVATPAAAAPVAAVPAPAAPAAAPAADPVVVASNIPAAAPVAAVPDAGLAAPAGGEENLADFTR